MARYKFKIKHDKMNIMLIAVAVLAVIRAIGILLIEEYALEFYFVSNVIIGALIILYASLYKEKTPILARIAMITCGLSWITPVAIIPFLKDIKAVYVSNTVFLWLAALILCISCIGKGMEQEGKTIKTATCVLVLLDFLSCFSDMSYYEYVNNSGSIHFWLPSLIVGVIFTAITAVLLIKDLIPLKDDRTSEKVALCFVALIFGFFITWATVSNLNYALDTNEPVIYEQEILEKSYTSGKRSQNFFHVNINGKELKIEVTSKTYREYEVGDIIEISYYEGAFNDPFYTCE